MILVVACNAARATHLAAIVESAAEAEAYVASIPEPRRPAFAVREVAVSFPLLILEQRSGFSVHASADLLAALAPLEAAAAAQEPDEPIANLYRIDEPFRAEPPGADAMGALRHVHLTRSCLEQARARGAGWLLGRLGAGRP